MTAPRWLVSLGATALIGVAGGCSGGGGGSPDASGLFVGVVHCTVDSDCDDGIACTIDRCGDLIGEGRVCTWQVAPGQCLIDGVCWGEGESRPGETCGVCDPANPTEWAGEGLVCDDGNACTFGTVCTNGACVGKLIDCNDGNPCTVDTCDRELGCLNEPLEDGAPCDDLDACTEHDTCSGGVCAGVGRHCDDGNPCTDDACDATGECTHTFNTAPCEDGDPCTTGEVCADGVCGGGAPETCDDDNPCTIDVCEPVAGCYHLPTQSPCCVGTTSICDDGDPCTIDLCDPDTAACSYEYGTAPCDDNDACTVNDACDQGTCRGTPRDCSDGNDCTTDECHVTLGCLHTPLDGTDCSDGLSCSTGDHCVAGVCEADTAACGCTPDFEDAAKVTTIVLTNSATAGKALDVDGNGTLDNALAPLGSFVNTPLRDALVAGSLTMLFEYLDFAPGPFTLALVTGSLDPANASCDFQTATCDYLADRSSLAPVTCARTISLPATRTGTFVSAGSPSTTLPLVFPLDASTLNLTVYMVNLQMTVTLTGAGVVGFSALLGGAVLQTELHAAIRALDPASLPMPPEDLISLLETVAPNDIDTNHDGVADAKSIAMQLDGIDGRLTGVEP